jgi:hypothetical protein
LHKIEGISKKFEIVEETPEEDQLKAHQEFLKKGSRHAYNPVASILQAK